MKLPCFIPTGVFQPMSKTIDDLVTFSGIVSFDFDNETTSPKAMASIMEKLSEHIVYKYVSPSGGKKFKVGIKIDRMNVSDNYGYRNAWQHIQDLIGVSSDAGTKNINRQSSVSYDPNCYINFDAVPYVIPSHVDTSPFNWEQHIKEKGRTVMKFKNRREAMEKCCEWTEKSVGDFIKGNRNNYIFKLSVYLNMLGFSEFDAIDSVAERIKHSKMDRREVVRTIESVYRRYRKSHGVVEMERFVSSRKKSLL